MGKDSGSIVLISCIVLHFHSNFKGILLPTIVKGHSLHHPSINRLSSIRFSPHPVSLPLGFRSILHLAVLLLDTRIVNCLRRRNFRKTTKAQTFK